MIMVAAPEAYLEHSQTSKMELFGKTGNGCLYRVKKTKKEKKKTPKKNIFYISYMWVSNVRRSRESSDFNRYDL